MNPKQIENAKLCPHVFAQNGDLSNVNIQSDITRAWMQTATKVHLKKIEAMIHMDVILETVSKF